MSDRPAIWITASRVLILLGVLCAVLYAFHVPAPVDLLGLAAAFGLASFLV